MELKKPIQIQIHTRAKVPVAVPSWVTNRFWPTTKTTTAEITAAIGRTFQSF
jgi:hypothetical protein